MSSTLIVAPFIAWVDSVDMYTGTGVLVLDELIMAGLAGVYFRRLRVHAAVHPVLRAEYERKRAAYLRVLLSEMELPEGVVVVGSHPSDVDLMDFEHVCAIRMADSGLRELSKLVYGDPMMLYIEYMSVLRALDDAVDAWHTVTSWHEVPLWLLRQYGTRGYVPLGILASRQRAILSELLSGEEDASVWLEDDLHLDIPMRRGFLVADYDYLTVIRPKWRDAVVRVLGSAPQIENLFRLPWYLIDSTALNGLCYRTSAFGRPVVSTRGQSLVEFVRARLSSVYTTRELVGTWIGGLLCDDITAVDTIRSLGFESLMPVGATMRSTSTAEAYVVQVPPEFAWMYEAVLDVKVVAWDGLRRVDGCPRVDATLEPPWAHTLPLASLFKDAEYSPRYATGVVQLLQRLHSIGVADSFLSHLIDHATDVLNQGPSFEVFDPGLTPLLPGYNYLFCFVPSVRYHVLDELGLDPSWSALLKYTVGKQDADGLWSVDQIYAEIVRLNLYAGQVASMAFTTRRVGDDLNYFKPGYCYICMFRPIYRQQARIALGAYPTLGQLLKRKYRSWCIPRYLDKVRVSCNDVGWNMGVVLHFTTTGEGVALRHVVRALKYDTKLAKVWLSRAYVGAITSCVGSQWFVLAVIGWTLVGATVFALLVWFTYMRCKGRGGGHYRY